PFREPGLIVAHIGQGEMSHLVYQHPIVLQLCFRDIASDLHTYEATPVAPGLAALNTTAALRDNLDPQRGGRKPVVVGTDNPQRALDPLAQRLCPSTEGGVTKLDAEAHALDAVLLN